MLRRRPVMVRRGPGLLGAAARTAVVAGTATAVTGSMRRRQDARAEQAQQAQQQAVAPPAPVASDGDQSIVELRRLADMKQQGLLTDAEFAAAKRKILGL
jgi:formiminotetrahydrofolate cyclodeaminase